MISNLSVFYHIVYINVDIGIKFTKCLLTASMTVMLLVQTMDMCRLIQIYTGHIYLMFGSPLTTLI